MPCSARHLDIPGQEVEVTMGAGTDEAAAIDEAAFNLFTGNELDEIVVGAYRLALHARRPLRADLGDQRLELVEERAPDVSGVAGARSVSRNFGLEDNGFMAASGGGQRGREAGESGAHHDKVAARRKRPGIELRTGRPVPPVGIGRKALGKDVVGHGGDSLARRTCDSTDLTIVVFETVGREHARESRRRPCFRLSRHWVLAAYERFGADFARPISSQSSQPGNESGES